MKPLIREIDKKYIEVIGHYDNPVLCAKLTLLAELYAVEHREGYALFKVEDYDKLSFINDTLEFSVSDLTGTTWIFNNSIDSSLTDNGFHINFTSNSSNYTFLYTEYDVGQIIEYGNTEVYGQSGWSNDSYKTISITGGSDVTNATLIAWLEANATLVDLTGTTWLLNNTINAPAGYGRFKLNFTSNGNNYNDTNYSFLIGYIPETDTETGAITYGDYIDLAVFDSNNWLDQAYRTISITGGTDATNPQLFAWLQANAVQQEPEPEPTGSSNLFIGGASISKMLVGNSEISKIFIGNFEIYNAEGGGGPSVVSYNISVTVGTNCSYSGDATIEPNGTATVVLATSSSSYDLPKTITVTGADYTYDGSTGNVVLSNPTGDVSITCGNAVLNYSVTVNLYNCKYNNSNQYNGKISAAGGYRDTLEIPLTLNNGYYFSQYSFVDNWASVLVSLANNVLTIQNVSAAYAITLNVVAMGNFKSKTVTLTTFKGFDFIETEQGSGSVDYQINFTSNNSQCTQISASMSNDGQKTSTTTYNLSYTIGGTSTSVATYASGASPVFLTWTNNAYKTLTFPNTDQYNDALYYNLVVNCGATFN